MISSRSSKSSMLRCVFSEGKKKFYVLNSYWSDFIAVPGLKEMTGFEVHAILMLSNHRYAFALSDARLITPFPYFLLLCP